MSPSCISAYMQEAISFCTQIAPMFCYPVCSHSLHDTQTHRSTMRMRMPILRHTTTRQVPPLTARASGAPLHWAAIRPWRTDGRTLALASASCSKAAPNHSRAPVNISCRRRLPWQLPEALSEARPCFFLKHRRNFSKCHSSTRLRTSRGVIGCPLLPIGVAKAVRGLAVILGIVAAVAQRRRGTPTAASIGTASVSLALPAVPCSHFERFCSGAISMAVMSDDASTRPRLYGHQRKRTPAPMASLPSHCCVAQLFLCC